MSSTESNLTEPAAAPGPPGFSPSPVALVVVMIALLAALVWAMTPSQPRVTTPAPLEPVSAGCLKGPKDFQPTNITDIPGPGLEGLGQAQKNRVLLRLNMEPCTCGCGSSIAACRVLNRDCMTSRDLVQKVVSEEKAEPGERR